jgi:hypothetical protein
MACIAWSYWITGDGRRKPAWLWRRAALSRNGPADGEQSLDFYVGEHTEGYEGGQHEHFPYHDVSVVLSADGRDPDSGYRFLIGAAGGHGVVLYRAGREVAREPHFRVFKNGHANTPRSIHVRAVRHGAALSLELEGLARLDWQDPQPLTGGGQVALGVAACRANFSDLVGLCYRAPEP